MAIGPVRSKSWGGLHGWLPVALARHQGERKGSIGQLSRHQGGRKEPFGHPGKHHGDRKGPIGQPAKHQGPLEEEKG